MHINLAPETLFHFEGIPVTNSFLAALATSLFLTMAALAASFSVKKAPGRWQNIMEAVMEGLLNLAESVSGVNGRRFFPLAATIFLFILTANWLSLLPGFGSIGVWRAAEDGRREFVPLLRGATADLNTTLALSLVSVAAIQYYGIKSLGAFGHLKKFINFKSPMEFFVGILELISEFAKIISFSFRLFGNIFAGEVLLAVMAGFLPVILPLPFLGLEVFVGFIQAVVFAMLTLVFLNVAVEVAH